MKESSEFEPMPMKTRGRQGDVWKTRVRQGDVSTVLPLVHR